MSKLENRDDESVRPDGLVVSQDDKSSTQRRMLSSLAIIVVAGVIGAGIGLLGGGIAKPLLLKLGSIGWVWLLLVFCLSIFIATLVHECGHLLGGRLVGFRFVLLIAGPLKVLRSQSGLQIRLNTNLALAGGLAACAPTDERDIPHCMLVMTAGGPLASLLLTVIAASLELTLGSPAQTGFVSILLLVTALISGALTVATLIPTRLGGFISDGARLLMLLRGGAAVERWCAQVILQLAYIEGKRPRDWNVSLLQKAIGEQDSSLEYALGCSFGYYHALDSGAIQQAKGYLEKMLAARLNVPAPIRAAFALEAAYFEARYLHDARQARVWLEAATGGISDRCTRLRVEAAVLLAEGKREEAQRCINAGLAQVKNALYTGTAQMEEAWLQDLQHVLESDS